MVICMSSCCLYSFAEIMENRIEENQDQAAQERMDELAKLDNRFGPTFIWYIMVPF